MKYLVLKWLYLAQIYLSNLRSPTIKRNQSTCFRSNSNRYYWNFCSFSPLESRFRRIPRTLSLKLATRPRVPARSPPASRWRSCDLIVANAVHHVGDGARFHRGEFLLENNTGWLWLSSSKTWRIPRKQLFAPPPPSFFLSLSILFFLVFFFPLGLSCLCLFHLPSYFTFGSSPLLSFNHLLVSLRFRSRNSAEHQVRYARASNYHYARIWNAVKVPLLQNHVDR